MALADGTPAKPENGGDGEDAKTDAEPTSFPSVDVSVGEALVLPEAKTEKVTEDDDADIEGATGLGDRKWRWGDDDVSSDE